MTEQAFSGVKVLDFTRVLAGPFCTYQMALLGAEVIKVEEPRIGDYMRRRGSDPALRRAFMGDHYLSLNGNKRSIVIDLDRAEGRDVARRLARQADVVVENFRAGTMDALGLGHAALTAENPGLIYCALSGFGAHGPDAGRKVYDQVAQASSGLAAATGEPGGGPVKCGAPVLDYASGTMAAFAISAALLQRARDGRGRFIDLSMHDTALMLMSTSVMSQLHGKVAPRPHGNAHPLAAASGYVAADGEVIMLGCCTQGQFETLCALIGRPDLPADPRFADVNLQDPHRDALVAELAVEMARRPAAEWEALLAPHVPAARVATLGEGIDRSRRNGRGTLGAVALPAHGVERIEVPVSSFSFDTGGPELTRAPPELGADTEAVLREAGFAEEEIAGLLAQGAVAAPDS